MEERYGKSPALVALPLLKRWNRIKQSIRVASAAAFVRGRLNVKD